MKVKIAMTVVALIGFISTAGLSTAQDTTKTTHKKTRTLTGCLQKGDDANEYKLTTAKGATWEIKSDTVKLGDHVAHTVTITGVVSNLFDTKKAICTCTMKLGLCGIGSQCDNLMARSSSGKERKNWEA